MHNGTMTLFLQNRFIHCAARTALAVIVALAAFAVSAAGEPPKLFDNHVHLHDGEASLQAYVARFKADNLQVAGIGAMWFGGKNQARAGNPRQIRAGNDGILALAAKYPNWVT
ncbi:MAG: hypothetical protein EOP02_22545, partial [Proteobacteria bacterium]